MFNRPFRSFLPLLSMGVLAMAATARPAGAACTTPGACALDFGGTNAYVTFGNTSALGLSQFTLELWVNRQGAGTTVSTGTGGITAVPLLTKGRGEAETPANVNMNYFLGINGSGQLAADFEDTAGGGNHPVTGSTILANDAWYHVAATYDGTRWRLYVNGGLDADLVVGATPESTSIQHAGLATAMSSTGVAGGFLDGTIDEARIWNYARTQAEIVSTINQEVTAATGLVARWGLNEGSGTAVADSAGTPQNGTVTGSNYQWTDGGPFAVDLPPAEPTLNAPTNGATGVSTTPVLDVTVSDPENAPLTVAYWGRELAPPGPDFTVVALPDTQYYSCGAPCSSNAAIFASQTQWIVDNRVGRNIAYVAHLGDCVEHGNLGNGVDPDPNYEWNNASASMSLLENPVTTMLTDGIPFGVPPGNHDQTPNGDPDGIPAGNSTASFNAFFGASRYAGRAYYGGHFGTDNDNHYMLFGASGLDFLVVDLEYDPSPDAAVLAWADSVLQAYPDRRAIVVSHHMLNTGNPGSFSAQGQAIYDTLKDNPNLFLLLGGHVPGEGRRQDTFDGRVVNSFLADYQGRTNGGNGWLRIMTFSPTNGTIQVQTYSPWLDQFETDADSQFTVAYDMSSTPFQPIATVSGVPSGSNVQATWPGRSPGTAYEWYAAVGDGTNTTTGPTWTFTTGTCGPDGTPCDDGVFCNGTDTCLGGACTTHAGNPCVGPDGDGNCAESCNEATDSCTAPDPNGAPCDDGVFCNGTDTCSGGVCASHAGDPCAGGAECNNACDEAADTCAVPAGTGCTIDGNGCTDDQCNGAGACAHPNNAAPCDDGLFCTVSDTCGGGTCQGTPRDCSASSDQCRTGTCDESADQCTGSPKPDGTVCDDADACTTGETCTAGSCTGGSAVVCPACERCDALAGCQVGPRLGCLAPTAPLASKLVVYDKTPDTADQVTWKWSKGAETTLGDLGTPHTTTAYAFCLFDQDGLVLRATAPAGGSCGTKPCWKALGTIGFKYTDKERTSDGVLKVLLKSGVAGRAKAQFKAKGDNVPLPSLPPLALPLAAPVTAQLQASGGPCWETTHSAPNIQRNDAVQFKARDD